MSVSGVSPFASLPTNDPRAEFQRLREIHSKGPSGYDQDREKEIRPSAAAEALADTGTMAGNTNRTAALRKVDFSI